MKLCINYSVVKAYYLVLLRITTALMIAGANELVSTATFEHLIISFVHKYHKNDLTVKLNLSAALLVGNYHVRHHSKCQKLHVLQFRFL